MPSTSPALPQTKSGFSPRALAAAFVLASAALSIALLAVRNLYDDEISSLYIIISPISEILRFSAHADQHPPGMYLLAHFAYSLLPSYRWMNLFPGLLLYVGLAVFLLQVTPLFSRTRTRVCLLLLATLHPQLLMWGATYRWYSWWTGLALITLTIALQPRELSPSLSRMRGLILGLLLAALFYLNYITLLFAAALATAMLLRYRPRRHLLLPMLLGAAAFLALIAPQFHTMIAVHLPDARAQRSGLAVSFLRLLLSVAVSEAYLPWNPLAIVAGLIFCVLSIAGLVALLRYNRARKLGPPYAPVFNSALASITLFGLLFFLLIAITRLGGKPRSALLLVPVFAVTAAWIADTLRPRAQTALLFVFALWTVFGIEHLLGRRSLGKTTMADRPEQVVDFVRQTSHDACSVVVTYDHALAFELDQSGLSRLAIVSPFPESTYGGWRSLPAGECPRTQLYAVQSYMGGDPGWEDELNAQLQSATRLIEGRPTVRFFSIDPEAGHKRSLARIPVLGASLPGADRLPDYRYRLISGNIDPTGLAQLRQRLPDYISGTTPR